MPRRITPGRNAAVAAGVALATGLVLALVAWAGLRDALGTRAQRELDRVSKRLSEIETQAHEALAGFISGEAAEHHGGALVRSLRRRAEGRGGSLTPAPLEFVHARGPGGGSVLLQFLPWAPGVLERYADAARSAPGTRWRVVEGPSGPVALLILQRRAAGVDWTAGRRVFPDAVNGPTGPGVAVEWWSPAAPGAEGPEGFLLNRTAVPPGASSRIGLVVTRAARAGAEDRASPQIRVQVGPRALWAKPASWAAAAGAAWLAALLLAPAAAYAWTRRGLAPWIGLWRSLNDVASGRADFGHARGSRDAAARLPAVFSTLQRRLEEQQRRRLEAERAAAWREAARVMAHEIRNALSPLRLGVQNLQKAGARDSGVYAAVLEDSGGAMLEEVGRLERLAAVFRDFAALPAPRPQALDLVPWVRSLAGMWEQGAVTVEVSAAAGLRVRADPDLLARALQNCVVNARQASGGHTVVLRLEGDGDSVRVRVEDQGPGFDDETLAHAFRPGYTRRSGGEGIGLALVHRIVREHGGRVRLSNRPGGGGRVEIELPVDGAGVARKADTGG